MFNNDLGAFGTGLTLNIDADSIAFALCCVFTDDDDASRQRIARGIQRKVSELMMDARLRQCNMLPNDKHQLS